MVKYVIIITTDKVYNNDDSNVRKKENNFLLSDSYSMSKVGVEKYVYYKSKTIKFKINC